MRMMILEKSSDYSDYDEDDLFVTDWDVQNGLINYYMINPVDSATLNVVTTATDDNYSVTVDGVEIDDSENFPLLQKVVGLEFSLQTALVFDLSPSVNDVDMAQLVQEAKDYIPAAKAHPDSRISQQQYTVWAFGNDVEELTSGFTADQATLEAALDEVLNQYNTSAKGFVSSLHKAVVQAIGRYINTEDSIDFRNDGNNDLVDVITKDAVNFTQLVMFSSGPDNALEFSVDQMNAAIQSQALVQYAATSTSDTVEIYKPVLYYVVGADSRGVAYSNLSNEAEVVVHLTLSGGEYSFASDLIGRQIAAIERRLNLDNAHVFSYAFTPRVNDHEVLFSSASTNNSYTLTTQVSGDFLAGESGLGTPAEEADTRVEITGPNGEYISGDPIKSVPFSDMQTFAPLTRWLNVAYAGSDYSWSISNGAGTTNANGTYTVTSVGTGGATLTLTNNALADRNTSSILVSD